MIKQFNEFLLTEAPVSKHITHLEESIFLLGSDGIRIVNQAMNDFYNKFKGDADLKNIKTNLKVDGCVHEDTLIITDKGDIKIKELISRIKSGEIINTVGYDENVEVNISSKIEETAISEPKKNWIVLDTDEGEIRLTEDHEVYVVGRAWVQAKDVVIGDDIKCLLVNIESHNVKVTNTTKLKEKYTQYDITTSTDNFYIRVGCAGLLIHNSPAIYTGIDPVSKKFFIATKSLFNKVPKINYTHDDINTNHSGGLADTLHVALDTLKSRWGDSPILQGDVMFIKKIIEKKNIDGESYVTFKPNTLTYAFPADDPKAKEVLAADFGVIFHTTYKGSTLQDLSATFGADTSRIKTSPKLWMTGVEYEIDGSVTFDKKEASAFKKLMDASIKQSAVIDKKFIDELKSGGQLTQMIQTHFNSRIRKGESIDNPKAHLRDFWIWLGIKHKKEVAKLKSEKGKNKRLLQQDQMRRFLKPKQKSLIALFTYQKTIIDMKELIIAKLEQVKNISVFVETGSNKTLKSTGQEGFTVIDKLSGNILKLVSRLNFSAQNFRQNS